MRGRHRPSRSARAAPVSRWADVAGLLVCVLVVVLLAVALYALLPLAPIGPTLS